MKSSLPLHHIVAKPQSCIGEQCAPALCRGFFMYTGVHECTRHFRHKNAPNCENSGRFVYIFVYTFRKPLTLNVYCGETGIRTLGTVARSPHFECGPIDHSGISPTSKNREVPAIIAISTSLLWGNQAEREGFEPPVPFSTTVFKTVVIDHSTISPCMYCLDTCFGRKRCKGSAFLSRSKYFGDILHLMRDLCCPAAIGAQAGDT